MSGYLIKKREEERAALKEQLKVCPVCKSVAFADMETCFSCLYQFDDKEMALGSESNSEPFQRADKKFFSRDCDFSPASIKKTPVVEGVEKNSGDNEALQAALGAVSFIDEGFEISIAVRPLKN